MALGLAVVGTAMAYYLHNWVEKRFKLDDAVGAVAVHGYCGVFGGIAAGFALWGYPAIYPSAGTLVALSEGAGWFGTNAEGLPIVTPWGNAICSIVFAVGFGFLPAYILSGILKGFGLLRVDPKVELTGLDGEAQAATYPGLSGAEAAFEKLQLKEGRSKV